MYLDLQELVIELNNQDLEKLPDLPDKVRELKVENNKI